MNEPYTVYTLYECPECNHTFEGGRKYPLECPFCNADLDWSVDMWEYQYDAMRTKANYENQLEQITCAVMGIAGESGELVELLKKHRYQGHPLDLDELRNEAGDILWYLALLCDGMDTEMGQVAEENIEKLEERYPKGFDYQKSRYRGE